MPEKLLLRFVSFCGDPVVPEQVEPVEPVALDDEADDPSFVAVAPPAACVDVLRLRSP